MALTSFQELQRASEHRESEMREALKGANSRSNKFEQEKEELLKTMNDQRINSASSAKEVEMLKESITKLNADIEKKTAEYEDARQRFSQVKEALTVERNRKQYQQTILSFIFPMTPPCTKTNESFLFVVYVNFSWIPSPGTRRN